MKTGTCFECKTLQPLSGGRLELHNRTAESKTTIVSGSGYPKGGSRREVLVEVQCVGSGWRPVETREKNLGRARARRLANVEAVRGEAAVALDALLHDRADLVHERRRLLDLALVAYRLENPKSRPDRNGFVWGIPSDRKKDYRTFCIFCGELIASFARGWYSRHFVERDKVVHAHPMVCGLQYLAGIRELVPPGTRKLPTQMMLAEVPDVRVPREWERATHGPLFETKQ